MGRKPDTEARGSIRFHGRATARSLGLILGLGLAAGILAVSRVPPGTGTLGAHVIIASLPSGELTLDPLGPIVRVAGLTPDGPAGQGTLGIYNQTGRTLRFQLRGVPSTSELDSLLWVEVDDGDRQVFRGNLGEFRSWSEGIVTLDSGTWKRLTVRTWLARLDGWVGRVAQIDIEFRSLPSGGPA
jgi:hypothetical protein